MWRKRAGGMEGLQSLKFSGNAETGGGFILKVSSRNAPDLAQGVRTLKQGLARMQGVFDIRDDLAAGESEIRPADQGGGPAPGLGPGGSGRPGGGCIRRIPNRQILQGRRRSHTQGGHGQGPAPIHPPAPGQPHQPGRRHRCAPAHGGQAGIQAGRRRYPAGENGRRTVMVMAALDKTRVSAGSVFNALQQDVIPDIEAALPGLTITQGGELEEEGEMQAGLVKALAMILVLIYALLAVPLKSYWKPVVIMSVIPFGFAGAVAGHYIAGLPLSVLSFFGMLALAGIVVNDSLVMLTRFNDILAEGSSVREALQAAGTSRFRAIFLTTRHHGLRSHAASFRNLRAGPVPDSCGGLPGLR